MVNEHVAVTIRVVPFSSKDECRLRLTLNGKGSFRMSDGTLWYIYNLGSAVVLQKLSGSTGVYSFRLYARTELFAQSPNCIWQKLQTREIPVTLPIVDSCVDVVVVYECCKVIQQMFIAKSSCSSGGGETKEKPTIFARAIRPNAHRVVVSNKGISLKLPPAAHPTDQTATTTTTTTVSSDYTPDGEGDSGGGSSTSMAMDYYTATSEPLATTTAAEQTSQVVYDEAAEAAAAKMRNDLEQLSVRVNLLRAKSADLQNQAWLTHFLGAVNVWTAQCTHWGSIAQNQLASTRAADLAQLQQDLNSKSIEVDVLYALVSEAETICKDLDSRWLRDRKRVENALSNIHLCKQIFEASVLPLIEANHYIVQDYQSIPFSASSIEKSTNFIVMQQMADGVRRQGDFNQPMYENLLDSFANIAALCDQSGREMDETKSALEAIFRDAVDHIHATLKMKNTWPQLAGFATSAKVAEHVVQLRDACVQFTTRARKSIKEFLNGYGQSRARFVDAFAQVPVAQEVVVRKWVASWPIGNHVASLDRVVKENTAKLSTIMSDDITRELLLSSSEMPHLVELPPITDDDDDDHDL